MSRLFYLFFFLVLVAGPYHAAFASGPQNHPTVTIRDITIVVKVSCVQEQLHCDALTMTGTDWQNLKGAFTNQLPLTLQGNFDRAFEQALAEGTVEFVQHDGSTTAVGTFSAKPAVGGDEAIGSLP